MAISQEGACDMSLSLDLSIGRSRRRAEQSSPCFAFSLSDGFEAAGDGVSVKREIVNHDVGCEEVDTERLSSFRSCGSDEDDDVGGARKKLRLTKEQSALLENRFKEHSTINPRQKHALAEQLNLRPRQIEVWFQNRRARTKLKQMEVDCEFLKKCCQKLSDENRKLHKELQQIKALKAAPPHTSFPAAVNLLTICPSCGRRDHSGTDQKEAI
ncbi:homeobox-leucine zipper protein HOX19-like [Zingiber officinale]|uniref:Homeobox domain-containing protein n=1 Tax=Zingiber officinale TaxID=94328 RepID=A0A8J5CDK4_ZINOF|nr:homeobox-leucine zipper protein HOX19-like [Zingiber officinale]KAG6473334.1 hypothetical protein ZIOFF_067249 [Zingiber officinale]